MRYILFLGFLFLTNVSFSQSNQELNQTILELKERLIKCEVKIDQLEKEIFYLRNRLDNNDKTVRSNSISPENQIQSGNDQPKNSTNNNIPNPVGSRCKAITKSGTQCKRNASSNGYCWQHGGQ